MCKEFDRDEIIRTICRIGGMWVYLNALNEGSSHVAMMKLGLLPSRVPTRADLSDASAWRCDMDKIVDEIDRVIGVAGITRHMILRHLDPRHYRYDFIAEQIRRPRETAIDLVRQAAAKFYAVIVERGITDDYRARIAA